MISFDISKDKIRRRVVKQLKANGDRVQKSVFECLVNDKQYIKMKNEIDKVIDKETDSVRYYQLCKLCRESVIISGLGQYTNDEDLIVV